MSVITISAAIARSPSSDTDNLPQSELVTGIREAMEVLKKYSLRRDDTLRVFSSEPELHADQFDSKKFVGSQFLDTALTGDYRGANFSFCQFDNVDLSNADIRGARFCGSAQESLGMSDPQFQSVQLPLRLEGNNFARSYIDTSVSLAGRAIENCDFSGARLSSVDLSNSIVAARMVGTNLAAANLRVTDLSRSDLSGALLNSVDLRSTILPKKLNGVDLRHSDLTNVDLRSSDLTGVKLFGAKYDTELLPSLFVNVDLEYSDLRGRDLSAIEFRGVNLKNCIFDEHTILPHDLSDCLMDLQTLQWASERGLVVPEVSSLEVQFDLSKPIEEDPFTTLLFEESDFDWMLEFDSDSLTGELAEEFSVVQQEGSGDVAFDFDNVLSTASTPEERLVQAVSGIAAESGKLYSLCRQVPEAINHVHMAHAIRLNESEVLLFHIDNELSINGAYVEAMFLLDTRDSSMRTLDEYAKGLTLPIDWANMLCDDLKTMFRCDPVEMFSHSSKGHTIRVTDLATGLLEEEILLKNQDRTELEGILLGTPSMPIAI
jgi:uncharacterized protein YjbI with pentapeptide repeats